MDSPIVAPDALAAWVVDGRADLRIVDLRWYLGQPKGSGRAAYDQGHLPGAIHVDLDAELVAPSGPGRHPLPDPPAFAASMRAHGIGDGDLVVVYDDVGGWVAARLWWMLEDLGFGADGRAGVVVLDGGIQAWVEAGYPLSTREPLVRPATLTLGHAWRRVIDRETLRTRLGGLLLLDARAEPRYRGEVEPIDPTPGHIPTAVNAPYSGNLGEDGRFRSAKALAARFRELRRAAVDAGQVAVADASARVVTSCGSGVSACHTALAMRIAGLPDPILYGGSYSDWSSAGLPVAVGAAPGSPPERGRRPAADLGEHDD